MSDNHTRVHYQKMEDFLAEAEDCSVVDELFGKLESEDSRKILDDAQFRRQEDWSFLAMQVVGSEHVGKDS